MIAKAKVLVSIRPGRRRPATFCMKNFGETRSSHRQWLQKTATSARRHEAGRQYEVDYLGPFALESYAVSAVIRFAHALYLGGKHTVLPVLPPGFLKVSIARPHLCPSFRLNDSNLEYLCLKGLAAVVLCPYRGSRGIQSPKLLTSKVYRTY
jgi:hypothetical protein